MEREAQLLSRMLVFLAGYEKGSLGYANTIDTNYCDSFRNLSE